ncbi:MAG: hypothetical protein WC693_02500 [Patescibacteria group bacterium]|jgi:poly-gamma-glutamate synthesis protein (capsule biosynthesis protein)
MAKKRVVVLSGAVVIVSVLVSVSWFLGDTGHKDVITPYSVFLTHAISNNQSTEKDVSGDNIHESYVLADGRLTVSQNAEVLWQTPAEWWVDSFELADATRDGKIDIALSVWKSGSFGPSKPFWVTEDDNSVKNHFFVFGFKEQEIQPVWQSSNLAQPNCSFTFADINNDSLEELLVIEGEYTADFSCSGNHLAVWSWREWGFYNDWRSNSGEYGGKTVNQYIDEIKKTYAEGN